MADCKCPLNLPERAEAPGMILYGKWGFLKKIIFPKLQLVSMYFIQKEGKKERSWRDTEAKREFGPKEQHEPLFTIWHLDFISASYMNFNIARYKPLLLQSTI